MVSLVISPVLFIYISSPLARHIGVSGLEVVAGAVGATMVLCSCRFGRGGVFSWRSSGVDIRGPGSQSKVEL